MNTIIGGFVGLLVVVAIVILGPTLAGSIEDARPALAADSEWNETHNTNMPNGSALWTQNVTIGGVVILVFFIALSDFLSESDHMIVPVSRDYIRVIA